MRGFLILVCSPLLATLVFWSLFGACVDTQVDPNPPVTRLVTSWDALACGDPHRVVVELGDNTGAALSASVPCNLGSIALDAAHFGAYRGRVYAWRLGAPIRSIAPIAITLDQPIVYIVVETPQ
jgi:hypothetical protein